MKKFLLLLLFAVITINAQRPIIIKYDASDKKIDFYSQGAYQYTYQQVGSSIVFGPYYNNSQSSNINVVNPGLYIVSIYPITTFKFLGTSNYQTKFLELSQWGDVTWDTSLYRMFYHYTNLKITAQDIPNFSNVTIMQSMFSGCTLLSNIPNINNWNVSNVTDMREMFINTTTFNQNLGNWKLNSSVDLSSMLASSGLSCQNYALTLKGWAENPSTPTNKNLGATNVKYGTVGKTYRDFLTTQKGWTFSGDIFEPSCNDALSTNENSLSEKLNFYPNPTTGRIFYQSKTDESLQINNTAGQLLKTIKVTKGTNQIDISEFPKGLYFLKSGDKTSKLLKN